MEKLSYKTKNRYLLIGSILFAFIAYFYSFNNTISEISEFKKKALAIDNSERLEKGSGQIKGKIKKYDALIGSKNKNTEDYQQDLLGILTNYCSDNRIVLKEFPNKIITSEDEYITETNSFEVSGSFLKILELIYLLETNRGIGKVASVKYMLSHDLMAKKEELSAKFYVQNFNRKADEK